MGRWISIVCFNMSVGISPTWVALEPSKAFHYLLHYEKGTFQ